VHKPGKLQIVQIQKGNSERESAKNAANSAIAEAHFFAARSVTGSAANFARTVPTPTTKINFRT
jgi:hypothetical protein